MACKNFVLAAYPSSLGSPRHERYLNEKDEVYKPRFVTTACKSLEIQAVYTNSI